jgi:transcription elongation factor Elf1
MAESFRVRCLLCNTVAESWHSCNVPKGKVSGVASCKCGKVKADSAGVKNRGRILTNEPESNWEVIT